jgi:hypothetical protein
MRHARRHFEALTGTDFKPRAAYFQHGLTVQNVKELPRLGMKMATFAVSWRHPFLDYAQLGPIEQVPSLAPRTPLIPFARCDVDYLKQGASKCAG